MIAENGCGKSTLLESLAIQSGLNPEDRSQNFNFSIYDSHSQLHDFITTTKSWNIPKTKYFLRAESFYNVAGYIEELNAENPMTSQGTALLHQKSHGESFIQTIEERFYPQGLYFLDEPESALSPINQMKLLILIMT